MKQIITVIFIVLSITLFSQDAKKEMRGVWIATVKNIDYPSNKLLSVEKQKKEFIDMLNRFQEIGINTIFFQVRPAADAFYPSELEPWSEWLTGKQGKAPEPYYDPLKFMIDETHKRGMEFHAWINPFRAVATIEFADVSEDNISKTKPEWVFTYDINKYLNPGIPEVRTYVKNIVVDIIERYDIDGIHFDDYFYPYPKRAENGKILQIDDAKEFLVYNNGFSNIEDWRRNNMNLFIEEVSIAVKEANKQVVFGIAPSGVWKNKSQDPEGSNTRGLSHYYALYSDVLLWLKNGWIDYVAPQLYWSVGNKYADYNTLVKWWSEHTYGRHLYIGHAVYNAKPDAKSASWRNPNEIPNQIKIARANPNVQGDIFYKAQDILKNNLGIADRLKKDFYKTHVAIPEMPWITEVDTTIIADDEADYNENINVPKNLRYVKLGNKVVISWDVDNKISEKYKVYKFRNYDFEHCDNIDVVKITKENFVVLKRKRFKLFRKEYKIVVTSVNKNKRESKASNIIKLKF